MGNTIQTKTGESKDVEKDNKLSLLLKKHENKIIDKLVALDNIHRNNSSIKRDCIKFLEQRSVFLGADTNDRGEWSTTYHFNNLYHFLIVPELISLQYGIIGDNCSLVINLNYPYVKLHQNTVNKTNPYKPSTSQLEFFIIYVDSYGDKVHIPTTTLPKVLLVNKTNNIAKETILTLFLDTYSFRKVIFLDEITN